MIYHEPLYCCLRTCPNERLIDILNNMYKVKSIHPHLHPPSHQIIYAPRFDVAK